MMTRCSMAITLSPGSGNFETRSVGWVTGDTGVLTRYISPTSRSSCWYVAIFFESGDHKTMARSLLTSRQAPHPEIPVMDEGRLLAVGRRNVDAHLPAPAATGARRGRPGARGRANVRALHTSCVTGPSAALGVEGGRLQIRRRFDGLEGEGAGRERALGGGRQRRP